MKTKIFLLCAAAFLSGRAPDAGALLPEGSFTDDARGLTSASFLKTPPSARFEAMAGACLTQNGPQSFFCNPAGLASAPKGAVSASLAYESLLEGSYRAGASIVRGYGYGAFAVGFLYNNSSPGMDKFDAMGLAPLGRFSAYDSAAGVAFARRFGLTDFGLGAKFIKSKLAEASGTSAALDAGFIFREPGSAKTEFSLAARNFGSPLKLGSERAPLPLEFGGGLKWKYAPDFDIMLEGRLPCDHSPYLIMAGEWFLGFAPSSGLFVRGGMNFKNYSDLGALGAFAGGFGLRLGALEFDYAFVPYGELGSTHRTEISWRFSGVKAVEGAARKPVGEATRPVGEIVVNTVPELLWTSEENYAAVGISTGAGNTTTPFVYRVKYIDADNDAPAGGYPKVHITKGGSGVSGSPFAMEYVSGDNKTGAVYAYVQRLASGNDYTYYFEANDSSGTAATGAPTMPVNGPVVVQAEAVKIPGGTNVAVADFIGMNVSQADASIVANFLRTGLVNTGLFNVMDRNNMDTVLAEQKFQNSGCTEQECAVEMGKLLNVRQMLVGSLSKLLDSYYITVNVVDVETGKIAASYDSEAASSRELRDACKKIVEKLSRK